MRNSAKFMVWWLCAAFAAIPTIALAEFPLPSAQAVIAGCRIARGMDATAASQAAAKAAFAADPQLAAAAGYCAGWAFEAFQFRCIPSDASLDDVMLAIINYSAKHPEYGGRPFPAIASTAIGDQWPACREGPGPWP